MIYIDFLWSPARRAALLYTRTRDRECRTKYQLEYGNKPGLILSCLAPFQAKYYADDIAIEACENIWISVGYIREECTKVGVELPLIIVYMVAPMIAKGTGYYEEAVDWIYSPERKYKPFKWSKGGVRWNEKFTLLYFGSK